MKWAGVDLLPVLKPKAQDRVIGELFREHDDEQAGADRGRVRGGGLV